MSKKIIFCVTNDLHNDQRMIRICTSLSRANYIVELVGRVLPSSWPLTEYGFRQKRLSCFFQKGKFFYLEYNLRLFFYLLLQKSDAICAIDLDTILPVFVVTKIKKITCVYDAHEYFTEVPEVIRRPAIQWIWGKIADFTIPKIKYCYTVGESLAKIFSQKYNVDFQVVRNISVTNDIVLNQHFSESEPKILLYQGALNEGRGLEYAIDAMHYLEGYELWLIGEGDMSQILRKTVIDKQLSDRVKFLGMCAPEDLRIITPRATLGIHFTENKGLSYYYSLANRTFDYIHAELPAIHPDFPEYQALMSCFKFGALLVAYDSELIAAQIRFICENKETYSAMKQACRAAKAEYCWEKEEIRLLLFYKRIFS